MRLAIAIAALMTVPFTANAQGRGHDGVPPGQMPPPGSCRIWFDGLPPGHEPLPTDCETAYRDAPPDARVLVGASVDARDDDDAKGDHGKHHGGDKGRGHKHDDDRSGECLAYQPDGVCAEVYAPASGPVVFPDMVGAVFAREGRVWPEVQRWLGGLHLTVHVDAAVAGRPTRVRWTDPNGALVQEWIDTNGDGRAEVVRVYRRGVLMRTYDQDAP